MNRVLTATAALVLTASAGLLVAGPLNPPAGPVGSTHKTLSEVEPRIAINAANTPGDEDSLYKITQPGSYYLTADLVGTAGKHGIQVVADDVTIDLNGFTLRGVQGVLSGITDRHDEMQPSLKNLTIRNGTIAGFSGGISAPYTASGRIQNLTVASNGSNGVSWTGSLMADGCRFQGHTGRGLEVDGTATITACHAMANGIGFAVNGGTLENCTAADNTLRGFDVTGATMRGCTARSNPKGIALNGRSTAVECTVAGASTGIELTGLYNTVRNCSISAVSSCGIEALLGDANILNNTIVGSTTTNAPAIRIGVGANRCHIEGNVGTNNGFGVVVNGTDCTIIRNAFGRSPGAQTTYQIAAGNRFGTIVHMGTKATATNLSGTTGTVQGTFSTTDPFANLNF